MQKTNLIYEVLVPALGCVAFGMLLSVAYQMWDENRNALLADKVGPMEISCEQLSVETGLQGKKVKITQVEVAPKYALTERKNGTKTVFLLRPKAPAEPTGGFPILLQTWSVTNPAEAKQFRDKETFTGSLRTVMALDFAHQDQIEELYPGIDLDNCYLLLSPGLKGSTELPYIAYGMGLFFGGGCLIFGIWLIYGIRSAVRYGVTLTPDTDPHANKTRRSVLEYSNVQPQNYQPIAPRGREPETHYDELPSRPWLQPFCKVMKIALGSIVLPMALLAKANMLPDWARVYFYCLFVAAAVFLLVDFFLMYRRQKNPGNNVRKLIRPGSVPTKFERGWEKHKDQLRDLGFTFQGDFLTSDLYHRMSREYLSADGRSLLRFTRDSIVNTISVYSVLDNGQLIMTVDMELPEMGHHKIHLLAGPRKDLAGTLSIHQQAIVAVADAVVKIAPDELHDFWRYSETLEEQMVGQKPFEAVPLPCFGDLQQQSHLTEVSV